MKSEEPSCVLRTLTLCDGQEAVQPLPRARPCECYCAGIHLALEADQGDQASELRTARARVVAHAAELERLTRRRQDWLPPF